MGLEELCNGVGRSLLTWPAYASLVCVIILIVNELTRIDSSSLCRDDLHC